MSIFLVRFLWKNLLKYRIIYLHHFNKKKLFEIYAVFDNCGVMFCIKEEGFDVRESVYRCTKDCPWNKHCFVCKVQGEISGDVIILHKCEITKEDIPVRIKKQKIT